MQDLITKNANVIDAARKVRANMATVGIKTGGDGLPFLGYKNKLDTYELGRDKDPIPEGTHAFVHPLSLEVGYGYMETGSAITQKRVVTMTHAEPIEAPQLAPYMTDGWKVYAEAIFALNLGGEFVTCKWSAINDTNRNETGRIMEEIGQRIDQGRNDVVPEIVLGSRGYTHNKWGAQNAPAFTIVGWYEMSKLEELMPKPAPEESDPLANFM